MANFSESRSRSSSGSILSQPEPIAIPSFSPPKRRSLSPSQRLHQLALDVASISPKAAAAFAALGRFAKFINTPPPWLSILALVNNQILFALMHVLASPTLKLIPPMGLAMLRVGIALPFLFFVAVHEKSLHKITLRDYPYMAFLGLVGVALPQTLIFVGNQLSGPNVIAIMAPAAPVYAAIFAVILKLEMFTWWKAGGTMLSVIGALVILRPDKMSFNDGASTGALIMVFQTACYATFLIALRIKMITHPYPFGIYAHASAWGLLYIMLVGLPTGWALFTPAMVPTSGWIAVVYCGFVISFFAHGVQSWAVKNTSASFPSLFSCLNPFFTGFLAFMILGETMRGASDAVGLMFNVAGLLMVIYSRQKYERGSTPKAMSTPLSHADRLADHARVAVVLAELEQGQEEYESNYERRGGAEGGEGARPVVQAWGEETHKGGNGLLKGVGAA